MIKNAFALLSFALCVACAPPGYENAAFTKVAWPLTDQAMTIDQRVEVEGRLIALNYLSEPADGVITRNSRQAIRSFQTDIGAPATGVISLPLLDALQTNTAYMSPSELKKVRSGVLVDATRTRPSQTTVKRTPTPRRVTPTTTVSEDRERGDGGGGDTSGDSGGSGGAGAGAWN